MSARERRRAAAAADVVLAAACRECVRQVRAGETTYIVILTAACISADLLLVE